ncbi:MAG: restriction endonuclease subunit S [Candidatus Thiocaldithrix dubininis]|uniref:Restriction endonuclease subunit S n=1 Tax=Candidatus Thiocaldithrix dubininis TaxID=3080823 RepID=A0AA95KJ25_9GAMM|nr:MAG: restriction endonuclease subunit S [Candidatus Thiocaldithrix dubininis]
MASEWQKVRFGEIYDIPSRNGLTKPKNIRGHGVKFINMGEVFAHDRIFNVLCDRVPITSKEKETSLLANNDLLFARQSLVLSGAGKCSIFLGDQETVAFESHLIRVRINNKLACPLFLFYLFKSSIGRSLIWNITEQGAGQSGIRGSDLENITFKLPLLKEQKAIAHILGSLDDKIELNRQMNATLEAMAQALFKSWFVDFDPVLDNALAAGNPIPDELQSKAAARLAVGDARKPLPAEIQALFPSSFILTEEMGWIPEGWEDLNLSSLLEIKYGKDHKALNEGTIPVYGSGGLMRYVDSALFSGESILIPRKGTLSNLMYVNETFWTVDTMFYSVPKLENTAKFLFYFLKTFDFNSMNVGSAVPSMTTKVLNELKVIKPSAVILEAFEKYLSTLFQKNKNLQNENKYLTNLRDTLLPKLLSGELRIPDAENLAAEVL